MNWDLAYTNRDIDFLDATRLCEGRQKVPTHAAHKGDCRRAVTGYPNAWIISVVCNFRSNADRIMTARGVRKVEIQQIARPTPA